jgi:hypothetical protein
MNILHAKYSNISEIAGHTRPNTYTIKRGNYHHKIGTIINAKPLVTTSIQLYVDKNENLDDKLSNTHIISTADVSNEQHFTNRVEIHKLNTALKNIPLDEIAYMTTTDFKKNTTEKAYDLKITFFQIN